MADRGLYMREAIWYIRFADQNGKIQRESSNSPIKSIAKQLLSVRKAEVAQGKFKKIAKREEILFGDYSDNFLRWAMINTKKRSFERYRTSVRQLLLHLQNKKMDEIKRRDIESYKEKRKEHVSAASINRDLACLKKLFNNAIADEVVDINPVTKIDFMREPVRSPNFLSEEGAAKLIKACDNTALKTFVIIGLNTGMRLNEILSLKWEQINLVDKVVNLRDTKNGREDSIPLTEDVIQHLQTITQTSEYVVTKEDGGRYVNFMKQWKRLVQNANVGKITPHVLRHTWATALVRAGVDLMTIMELGRWSDLKLVKRYAHIDAKHRTREIKKLEGKFGTDTKSSSINSAQ